MEVKVQYPLSPRNNSARFDCPLKKIRLVEAVPWARQSVLLIGVVNTADEKRADWHAVIGSLSMILPETWCCMQRFFIPPSY